ncbi:hypothetical protein ACJQWK_09202 [Exserohilum turcicum]|uniref:Uncharacterized protein n=1 Tax=Exserohilum turcicum (strain 28A) TaxID=671987 RepID=R0KNL1_EXST2|nr:uncharacterized protein SETTUDRAFT_38002 [Exserohilum turcica Et28A]EOA89502.1 hypothetical protein SETTUDRAFT_38002 [Exserohilum turcica Et28A]
MDFTSFNFDDDSFFDFNGASSDGALPSVEPVEELPISFPDGVSLADIERPCHGSDDFFDSAFGSDDTNPSDLHSDMSVWPCHIPTQELAGIQGEKSPSPPSSQISEGPRTGLGTAVSPIEVSESMGPIEQLWRPIMGYSPPAKLPPRQPKPRTPRKPDSSKVKSTASKPGPKPGSKSSSKPSPKPKVTKVTKKRTSATQKRTAAAPVPRERSIQELYNAAWDSLTQEEKGRLLLPLLQGINPDTGVKVTEASTLLPPPDFAAIGANMATTNHALPSSSPTVKSTSSDFSYSSYNTDAEYDAIGADYSPPTMSSHPSFTSTSTSTSASIDTDFATTTAAALQAYNSSHGYMRSTNDVTFGNSFDCFDGFSPATTADDFGVEVNHRHVDRGLGGPFGNGMISDPIHMPAPPSVYGCTRQQEALERSAMLRAQGRRR